MRRFRYDYSLTLRFSAPISRHSFLLRFWPNADACQQLWGREIWSAPESSLPLTADAFGNACACGHIEAAHEQLILRAHGEALIRGGRLSAADCPAWCRLTTPLTHADGALLSLARDLPADPMDCAMEASRRIHEHVEYRRGATDDRTTAAEALRLGAGVCQDFAHMLLAILRARDIPARYVAGLIPGEGETHAWVELYDGAGFIGIDPTQLRPTDDGYLRVNVGRDSRDCAINRGMFTGTAQQSMEVCARMVEI